MAKESPLSKGLERKKGKSTKSADIHKGTVLVAGHFSPDVQRTLRIIAAEESVTIQALLAEAINTVFAKRGRPEIAASSNAAPETPAPVDPAPVEQEMPA